MTAGVHEGAHPPMTGTRICWPVGAGILIVVLSWPGRVTAQPSPDRWETTSLPYAFAVKGGISFPLLSGGVSARRSREGANFTIAPDGTLHVYANDPKASTGECFAEPALGDLRLYAAVPGANPLVFSTIATIPASPSDVALGTSVDVAFIRAAPDGRDVFGAYRLSRLPCSCVPAGDPPVLCVYRDACAHAPSSPPFTCGWDFTGRGLRTIDSEALLPFPELDYSTFAFDRSGHPYALAPILGTGALGILDLLDQTKLVIVDPSGFGGSSDLAIDAQDRFHVVWTKRVAGGPIGTPVTYYRRMTRPGAPDASPPRVEIARGRFNIDMYPQVSVQPLVNDPLVSVTWQQELTQTSEDIRTTWWRDSEGPGQRKTQIAQAFGVILDTGTRLPYSSAINVEGDIMTAWFDWTNGGLRTLRDDGTRSTVQPMADPPLFISLMTVLDRPQPSATVPGNIGRYLNLVAQTGTGWVVGRALPTRRVHGTVTAGPGVFLKKMKVELIDAAGDCFVRPGTTECATTPTDEEGRYGFEIVGEDTDLTGTQVRVTFDTLRGSAAPYESHRYVVMHAQAGDTFPPRSGTPDDGIVPWVQKAWKSGAVDFDFGATSAFGNCRFTTPSIAATIETNLTAAQKAWLCNVAVAYMGAYDVLVEGPRRFEALRMRDGAMAAPDAPPERPVTIFMRGGPYNSQNDNHYAGTGVNSDGVKAVTPPLVQLNVEHSSKYKKEFQDHAVLHELGHFVMETMFGGIPKFLGFAGLSGDYHTSGTSIARRSTPGMRALRRSSRSSCD